MKRSDWIWGLGSGIVLGLAGFALRGNVGWPLEGLFAQITYWLGVPFVFNLLHKILGYGEAGKNLAFFGTAILWLLIHAFLFALLRRRLWVGLAAAFVFYGVFGSGPPGMNTLDWRAAVAYTALLGVLAFLLRRPKATQAIITDPARRESLKTLGVLALGLMLWQQARAQAKIMWEKIIGLSPEQTDQRDLYYVSKNIEFLDPKLAGKPYKLEVSGLVNNSLSLSLDEIKALPSVELYNTLTCISNPIGGDLIGHVKWKGTPLKAILDKASVKGEARFIVWEAADRYMESIPIGEIPAGAILAYAAQNPETGKFEDLSQRHGYPTRILLPGRYGMKQPRWLTRISLSASEVPGYWVQRGWSRTAVIRTMSRIDTPANRARLKADEETFIAGIAYAGGRALGRVEVSTDGGKTWQKAELKPSKSKYSWQLWALPWKPSAGDYIIQARAVEVGEKVQDATVRNPLPDGATGYHTIGIKVG